MPNRGDYRRKKLRPINVFRDLKMNKLYKITLYVIGLTLVSCNSKTDESVPTYFPYKVNSTDRWGLVDVNGKALIEDEFKNEPSAVIDEMFFVENNGEYEIYSINNPKKEVVGEKFKDIAYFSEGIAPCVKDNEGIKYIDKQGKVKFELPPEYLYATRFVNGYSRVGRRVKLDTRLQTYGDTPLLQWDVVNTKGTITKLDKYSIEKVFPNSNFLVYEMDFHSENDFYIFSSDGAIKTKLKDYKPDLAEFGDIISPDIKYYVFYDSEEGKYGVRNMNGETIIKAKYEGLLFLKNGKLAFCEDYDSGGVGIMDIKGNVLFKPKYKWITLHDNDKYLVLRDDKMALLNSKEDRLIDYKHELLLGLSDKVFVSYDEGYGYKLISIDGETIASFEEFDDINNKYDAVKSDFFDAEDCIKAFMNSVESLYGLFGLTIKDCSDKIGLHLSTADITDDNWIPDQFLQQNEYGKIYYSLGFDKILECYEPQDDYFSSEICVFSDKPCGGIIASLQFNPETLCRYEEIRKQLEKVLFSLGYSEAGTSSQGNQMYSRSGIDIVKITVNAHELCVKVYNEYLGPSHNNASLSPEFHQQVNSSVSQFVVIDGSQLRLRLDPSTSSDTFKWPDGTNRHPNVGDKFKYLGESGDFYKIDFNGTELWVSKQYSHLE